MAQSLYQKYRPQTFAELIGQDHVTTTLQNELASGTLVRAYLFTGPRGLGKTTVARLLAKALNCQRRKPGQSEPCNECDTCLQITQGRNLDVMEIDAASHTGVDTVRESIIATARLSPSQSKYKVFIIDEVHMLSVSAFNALLKTLEEPPAHVVFVLATTEIHKVPQTIISRCQRFDFRKVKEPELVGRLSQLCTLEKKQVPASVLAAVARHSEGCVRDAESVLGQIFSLGDTTITAEQAELVIPLGRADLALTLLDHIAQRDLGSALAQVNQLVDEGVDLHYFTRDVIEVVRLLLLRVAGAPAVAGLVNPGEQEAQFQKLVGQFSIAQLARLADRLNRAAQELKTASILQLPLEIALAEVLGDEVAAAPLAPVAAVKTVQVKKSSRRDDPPAPSLSDEPPASKERSAEIQGGVVAFTLDQVRTKWDDVLARLKDHNHSLASTLRQHRPAAVRDDGSLEFQFTYKFHEQRVNEVRNRQILETVLEEIFGRKFRIQTVVVDAQSRPAAQDSAVSSLVSAFGGQLVD